MDFRRIEVRRALRHAERISDKEEVRKILDALRKYELKFSLRVRNVGSQLGECSVLSIGENDAKFWSRLPQKVAMTVRLEDIEALEVEANLDLTDEVDDGGRWARII